MHLDFLRTLPYLAFSKGHYHHQHHKKGTPISMSSSRVGPLVANESGQIG
jgi:hypothetical protein